MADAMTLHLQRLYRDHLQCDASISIPGGPPPCKPFTLLAHRVVLSQSPYFAALLKDTSVNEGVEFVIEAADPDALTLCVNSLYGLPPVLSPRVLFPTLSLALFLAVERLPGDIADYVFAHISGDLAIEALAYAWGRELGEAGGLIMDAAFAYLYRNAVEVGTTRLAKLPVAAQVALLTAEELYVPSESARYRLAVGTLRAGRSRLFAHAFEVGQGRTLAALAARPRRVVTAGLPSRSGGSGEEMLTAALQRPLARLEAILGGAGTAPFRRTWSPPPPVHQPAASLAASPPPTPPPSPLTATDLTTWRNAVSRLLDAAVTSAEAYLNSLSRQTDLTARLGAYRRASSASTAAASAALAQAAEAMAAPALPHAPPQRSRTVWTTSVSGSTSHSSSEGPAVLRIGGGGATAELVLGEEAGSADAVQSSLRRRMVAATSAAAPPPPAQQLLLPSASPMLSAPSQAAASPTLAVRSSGGPSPRGLLAPPPVKRDFTRELTALNTSYASVFSCLRLVHLSESELQEVASDGEVDAALLAAARRARSAMLAKLAVASHHNVKRLSELKALAAAGAADAAQVEAATWPPLRFGVEVCGLFAPHMRANDEQTTSLASDRVSALGSIWALDLKRYLAVAEGAEDAEFVAVYLRRRAGGTPLPSLPGEPAPFEDVRDLTTLGFTLRLCGAPGAPTSNSVAGRSTAGKSFGTSESASWGWEAFLSLSNVCERETWTTGDVLRFSVALDML